MAIGFNFLTKTGAAGMNGLKKTGAAQQNSNANSNSSIFAQNQNQTQSAGNADMASMNTSDLMKYVYQNNPANDKDVQSDAQSKASPKGKEDDDKNGNIQLPNTVEYGNEKFGASGKKFEDIVKEISQKTNDSTCKVESELKRKYASTKGAKGMSLNMQA